MKQESAAPASRLGDPKHFTGSVWINELIVTPPATGLSIYRVLLEPSARTAWHSHPKGQILMVESGAGYIQTWGEPIQEMSAGEVVYIEPDVKHWHGATPTHTLTHLAIQPSDDGELITWLELVTDTQYLED